MTTQIYLLTPPQIPDLPAFAAELSAVCETVEVAAIQIRLKTEHGAAAEADEVRKVFAELAPIARTNGVEIIINDDPLLALELDAEGVHLGQSDMDVKAARKLLGPKKVIGITAHNSRHLAMAGAEAGADYVAFGAFFPTATKKTEFTATPELLAWWVELFELPCVAIGGIRTDNVAILARAGADLVALSSGIWQAEQGALAACQALQQQLETVR